MKEEASLLDTLERFTDEVKELSVLVIGETIKDVFVPARYQGQSMKSFCPVFEFEEAAAKEQRGGALAIHDHIAPFVKRIDLLSNEEDEVVKTRYYDPQSGRKHAEVNRIAPTPCSSTVDVDAYDVVIMADFGHGFCENLTVDDGFHLMAQTNSNNFGFNRVSKWSGHRKRSVCIDLREASLQMNRHLEGIPELSTIKELYDYELNSDELFVTIGKNGSLLYDGLELYREAVYPSRVIDTIGAGDAFFAFAALSGHTSLSGEDRLKVPSLAASLSTTWLGNERNVDPASLKAHAEQLVSEGIPERS